jgi:hypothetical protein
MAFPKIGVSDKGGGRDFEPVPEGVHFAICREVIHIGMQPGFGTYPAKEKVYFGFEIPGVHVEWEKDGKKQTGPAKIGTTFTLSIAEKSNLRPFLKSWRGKDFTPEEAADFDVTRLLGKVCQLSVVHTQKGDKVYANVSGAFGLSEEQKVQLKADPSKGVPKGELLVYTPAAHDQAVFEKLPQWLQKKISERIKEPVPAVGQDFDDEIPF